MIWTKPVRVKDIITGEATIQHVEYTPSIDEIEACIAGLYHDDNPELTPQEIADQIDELICLLDERVAA